MKNADSNPMLRLKAAFLPDHLLYWGLLLLTVKVNLTLYTNLFTVPELIDSLLAASGLVILFFFAVKDWCSPKEMLLCGIGLGIIALSCLRAHIFHLLLTAVTVLALRGQDVKKAVRYLFHWNLLFFVVMGLLAVVLDALGLYSIWMKIGVRSRFFFSSSYALRLGYQHYTIPGIVVFSLIQMWCYLHFGAIRKSQMLLLLLISFALYELTTARLILVSILFLLVVAFIYQKRIGKPNPLLDTGAAIGVPVLFLLFLVILVNCQSWPPIIWKLNKWMSTRLAQPAVWYSYRGLSWLGDPVKGIVLDPSAFHVKSYTNLDCLYTMAAVWQGILPFLVICLCFFRLARKKMAAENVMILSWAVISIAESCGLNCYLEFPLLLTALALPKTTKATPKA